MSDNKLLRSGALAFAVAAVILAAALFAALFMLLPAQPAAAEGEHDHNDGSWSELPLGVTLKEGNYYLSADATGAVGIEEGNVTLCLNGHMLHGAGPCVVIISKGGTLTLCDCNGSAGEHYYTVGANGKYIFEGVSDQTAGAQVLQGGAIAGSANGGIYINGGTLNMSGGTIAGNSAQFGGGVYVNNGTFTMTGGAIAGNTSESTGGGVHVINNSAFTMSGTALISGNTAQTYGGGVAVTNGGSFTLSGGAIADNTAKNMGGGVYAHNSAFEMSNGVISGNSAATGGGVNSGGSTFELTGGTIAGNSATGNGGGVYASSSTVTVGDAVIAENTAARGGGVFVYSGAVTAESGNIGGNSAENGGGVYLGGGTFSLTGTAQVADNTAASGSGICAKGGTLTVAGGSLGGTAQLLSGKTASFDIQSGKFTQEAFDSVNALLAAQDQKLFATAPAENGFIPAVAIAAGEHVHPGDFIRFSALTAGGELADGHFYLEENLTLASGIAIVGNVTLCLNGHMLQGAGSAPVITISGGTLTLCDCNGSNGTHYYTADEDGKYLFEGVSEQTAGAQALQGGAIAGGDHSNGGGIYINSGTLNMSGGTIAGNSAANGGGVYVNNGTFTMTGGAIAGNCADTRGGGVYAEAGTLELSGGGITGNAAHQGGGVCVIGGAAELDGALLSGNGANFGGGLYAYDGAQLTVSGGTLENNSAVFSGGGLYVSKSALTMTGGAVKNNSANDGGGLYAGGTAQITLSGGEMSANTARMCGGGLYAYGSSAVTLTDGFSLSGNRAEGSSGALGGGAFIYNSSALTIGGGSITGNSADGKGGGVYSAANTAIDISGAPLITANSAGGSADNLHLADGVIVNENNKTNAISGAAQIGVTLADERGESRFAYAAGEANFTSDKGGKTEKAADGGFALFYEVPVLITGLDGEQPVLGGITQTENGYVFKLYHGANGAFTVTPPATFRVTGVEIFGAQAVAADGAYAVLYSAYAAAEQQSISVYFARNMLLSVTWSYAQNGAPTPFTAGTTLTYNGSAYFFTASASVEGSDRPLDLYVQNGALTNAGDYTLTATLPQNFVLAEGVENTLALTISPAPLSGSVSVNGTFRYGDLLTASYGGAESVRWQWYRGENAINGATGSQYALTEQDVGKVIRAQARAADPNHTGTAQADTRPIERRAVTFKADDKTSAAGSALQALTATLLCGELAGGDSAEEIVRLSCAASANSAAGEYQIAIEGVHGGYDVTGISGTYTLTAPALPDDDPALPDDDPALPDTDPELPDTDPEIPDTDHKRPDTDPALPDTDPELSDPGLSDGAIAGIAVGGAAAALLLAYALLALLFKKGIVKGAFFEKLFPFIKR